MTPKRGAWLRRWLMRNDKFSSATYFRLYWLSWQLDYWLSPSYMTAVAYAYSKLYAKYSFDEVLLSYQTNAPLLWKQLQNG